MDGLAALRQTDEFQELLRQLDAQIRQAEKVVLDAVSQGDMDKARLNSGVTLGLSRASSIFRGKNGVHT